MIINPCILMRVMPEGSLWPVLCNSNECSIPTFIVLPSNLAGADFIKDYKAKNLTPEEIEFRFVDIGPIEV